MPNLFLEHLGAKPSQPPLPLQGLMVLVVEDSRYAAEAMRLMCQRSGARLKRAEDLRTAQAHLHDSRSPHDCQRPARARAIEQTR